MTSIPTKLARALLWLIVGGAVFSAITITGLRVTLPYIDRYQPQLTAWAEQQIGLPISVGTVNGRWFNAGPEFTLSNVALYREDSTQQIVSIGQVSVALNFWQSLLQAKPVFKDIEINQLKVDLTQLPKQKKTQEKQTKSWAEKLEQLFLVRLDRFTLQHSQIILYTPSGKSQQLDISDLNWRNHAGHHLAEGTVSVANSHLSRLKVMADFSEQGDLSSITGQFYVQASKLAVTPWLHQTFANIADIKNSEVSFESWINVKQGLIEQSTLALGPIDIAWQQNQVSHQFKLKRGVVSLAPLNSEPSSNQWYISTHDFAVTTDGQSWPQLNLQANVNLNRQYQLQGWKLQIADLDLARLRPLLGLFPQELPAIKTVTAMKPQGLISQLRVSNKQGQQPQFSADFSHVAIKQWQLIPGIHKLNGQVSGSLQQGKVQLSLTDDQLPYQGVFQAPLNIKQANVTGYWQVDKDGSWRLWSDHLAVTTPDLAANGVFRLDFPYQQPAWLSFYGDVDVKNAGATWRYLPIPALGSELTDYLSRAIRGGEAKGAKLLWYGALQDFPYSHHNGIFQVDVPLKKARFIFDTAWPELTDLQLDLVFKNDWMYLDSHHVKTMGAVGSRVTGASKLASDGHLKLDIDVAADGSAVRDYMLATPLVDSVGAALTTVQVSGPVSSQFSLDIPYDGSQVGVTGYALLNKNRVALQTPNIELDNVSGKLNFHDDKILAQGFSGRLLQQPIDLSFSGATQDEGYQVLVDLAGDWQLSPLQKQWQDPLLEQVSGSSQWQSHVAVHLNDTGFGYDVDLKAGLANIISKLPYPLAYIAAPKQQQYVTVKAQGDKEKVDVTAQLPDMNYQMRLNLQTNEPHIVASYAAIGKKQLLPWPLLGQRIDINSEQVNLDDWRDVLSSINHSFSQAKQQGEPRAVPSIPLPTQINGQVKQLIVGQMPWHDVTLTTRRNGANWHGNLASREATGTVNWYAPNQLNINLKRLFLTIPGLDKSHKLFSEPYKITAQPFHVSAQDRAVMSAMPNINLSIADAWLQGYRLGKVEGQLLKKGSSLTLPKFSVTTGAMALNMQGAWQIKGNTSTTQLSAKIKGEDSTDLMGRLGISGGIQDASFKTNLSASWQGTPWQIRRETLTGQVKTKTGKGIISGVGGAGRLLGLFSIDSIIRKMQLDFSGIFENGLAFDYIKGSGDIKNGIFTTKDLTMKALAGDMTIKGQANLVKETVDANVKFIPDFTSGIPVLTAFAVAPQTALYVFAISTALSPVLDVFTQVNYYVHGKIDDPVVTERSRFQGEYKLPETKQ
ncbi:YhdP family protein [Photobacterium damselae]|uniref:YhdP family protein n=1 Tax=Photobacterium damselae TaxID=38293 RepID=UPI0040698CB0